MKILLGIDGSRLSSAVSSRAMSSTAGCLLRGTWSKLPPRTAMRHRPYAGTRATRINSRKCTARAHP